MRWAGSHLAFSLLGSTVALAVAGLTTGLAHGLNVGDAGREVSRVLGAAMLQLPAVWTLAGVAVALFGLLPRLAPAAWGAYGACFLIGIIGTTVRLSQWVMDLSPFTHTPRAFGVAVSATPVIWLTAVAVALVAAGLAGLRRRDIPVL
jgi:ABC-2 type transport system permease protein